MASGPVYDVIVVGARCGGAPLAMLLARAGHRVALVDRASFPSDTMSTHFLWQRGTARLQAWGLLGRLRARGCAPIRQITFDPGPVQMSGTGPAVAGAADTYCPRRTVLDALLVEAAAESGADLIERFVAGEVIWSDGRATGVRGRHCGSAGSSLRAAVVVGADGMHSGIARRVGARAYRQHPSLTAVYYSYWSGIRGLGASFHARPGQLILTWPTNDDLTCIYVAWPRQDFHQVRRDIEGHFHSALELVPGLREAAASGHREAPFTGTGDLPNYYRASAGPGWALAGDAGHHKDPCTGMGMSDAFLAADLLADAIHQALAGHQPMDQALACYQKRRDALTANGFELTLSTARLAPLSLRLEALYRAAADQPEIARHVFGVLGGSIPLTDLHTQARLLPASLTAPRRPARFLSPPPPSSQPRNWMFCNMSRSAGRASRTTSARTRSSSGPLPLGWQHASLPRPLAPPMLAEGAPSLGLIALIQPGLAPGRCLHLLGQLLRAAGCDQRSLAPDRDPHAFQGIKHDAPPGEPGPELASVVSRMGVVIWHGIPLFAESQPVLPA